MDAIILAGGKGTRLQKVVSDVPKPLALINNTPFLDLLIAKLDSFDEINNIILSVGYKKDQIIERYKKRKNILFSEEEKPLGTGGAIKKALKLSLSENVLVLNGDTYQDFDLEDISKFHIQKQADVTIVYREEKKIDRYGNILIDKNQKIISFQEKTQTSNGFINSGIYLMKKNVFDSFHLDAFSIENDFFSKILKKTKIFGFQNFSTFIDIGTKESYNQAQDLLKNLSF